jgi:hypothetical protein
MNWAPRSVTMMISAVLVILGVAILVETAVVGGGIGYLLGALFVSAGALRLYLWMRG